MLPHRNRESDGSLIVVRELDERLDSGDLITQHMTDSRRGKNAQFPLADLLGQSVYSRIAGYKNVNDTERLSQNPPFRLIGSEKIWKHGAALPSRLQSFEADLLTQEKNIVGLDMDSTEIPAHERRRRVLTTATSSPPAATRCYF